MGLSLQCVDKIVAGETHLHDINLDLPPGSRNVVLGRTQAGKTSLLRILAGLDRPTRGKLFMDGREVTGISVRHRNVAMVYQQFINYPSLSVYENIASPLKISRQPRQVIDRRVRDTAAMLHLTPLLDRLPAELSGGQQQRTAIARALVKESRLLLLDEPLVNLDYKLREELRVELQQIFEKRQAIVVYTTTEPSEALMLGGNIIVLDEGRMLQTGPTPEVFRHPATTRVAEVFSDPPINYLDGIVEESVVRLGQDIRFPLNGHMRGLAPGGYRFGIRCNHLFLNAAGLNDTPIQANVELCEINGSETFIHIRVKHEGTRLVVQNDGVHQFKIGSDIKVFANPGNMFVYNVKGRLVAAPSGSPQS